MKVYENMQYQHKDEIGKIWMICYISTTVCLSKCMNTQEFSKISTLHEIQEKFKENTFIWVPTRKEKIENLIL